MVILATALQDLSDSKLATCCITLPCTISATRHTCGLDIIVCLYATPSGTLDLNHDVNATGNSKKLVSCNFDRAVYNMYIKHQREMYSCALGRIHPRGFPSRVLLHRSIM